MRMRLVFCWSLLFLTACSSPPKAPQQPTRVSTNSTATNTAAKEIAGKGDANPAVLPKANSGRGGYYQDDGPGDDIPPNLAQTEDPIPTLETYSRTGNRPYTVFGKTYTPIIDTGTPFTQRGVASWYGKKFHGKRTSSGEPYDMYKITAAHPVLPIPSYARVTNLANGKQIIVRINDRGPFHSNRIMDLSYTAALKLDYLGKGSSEVEVERLLPEDIAKMAENQRNHIVQSELETRPAPRKSGAKNQAPAEPELSLENLLAQQAQREAARESEAKNMKLKPTQQTPKLAEENQATTASVAAYYLQFSAFAIRANAEKSLNEFQAKFADKAGNATLEIIVQGNLYRLQSGPFASKQEAQVAADSWAIGSVKPIVVQR